jgi:5-methylcytosine-specific restriction enzyme B
MATGDANQKVVFNWINTFLRDRNLQLARVGTGIKNGLGSHTVDETTGNWGDVGHSKSKPPRWLLQVDLAESPIVARFPDDVQEANIGHITTTASRQTAAVALRILPMLQTDLNEFVPADDFEVTALFLFHGGLEEGSSSDSISLNISNGRLLRVLNGARVAAPYIFSALLGLRPRTNVRQVTINGTPRDVTYGEVLDALQSAITVHPKIGAAGPIQVYDLSDDNEAARLKADMEEAWNAAGPPPQATATMEAAAEAGDEQIEEIDPAALEVPINPELLGVDDSVYRQINALLRSGKQHLMLYGPPGTGKTTLARWIATSLSDDKWTLVTGSSDWSSQDIIGGYQPVGDGDVDFVVGVLLRDFDRPLIIDELNRCDIDKVIGPLFTVLSGQQTTLPYRTDIADVDSQPYVILPQPKAGAAEHEFAPGPAWRLIATINSIDKASLYQMSYALSRRFGWVYVAAPQDLAGFVREYLESKALPVGAAGAPCPLAEMWKAINAARVIGPAPIIDAIHAIQVIAPGSSFFGPADAAMQQAALDAIDMVLLPMLDGIVHQDAMNIADAAITAFGFAGADAERVKRRFETVAI